MAGPNETETADSQLPVSVYGAVDPGPDQAASYCEELLVGGCRIKLRSTRWSDDPALSDRLVS